MTKSRGIRVRRGTRTLWLEAQQGRHRCQCGCGEVIPLRAEHFNIGIPTFLLGHNRRVKKPQLVTRFGYAYVLAPDHPFANKKGRIPEHRKVLEEHLRDVDPASPHLIVLDGLPYLRPEIEVHHIDGNKMRNVPANLRPMTKTDHARLHEAEKRG